MKSVLVNRSYFLNDVKRDKKQFIIGTKSNKKLFLFYYF